MTASLQSLMLVILASFLFQASCFPQTAPTTTGPSLTISSTLAPLPPIMGIGCMTGAGDARMDSFTVKRLSGLYCDKLLAHFPTFTGTQFHPRLSGTQVNSAR